MDRMVTGFPFSICSCPMYLGSWMSFVAVALFKGSLTGLVLRVEVGVGYILALRYEDPFTAMIYEKRERGRKMEKKDM